MFSKSRFKRPGQGAFASGYRDRHRQSRKALAVKALIVGPLVVLAALFISHHVSLWQSAPKPWQGVVTRVADPVPAHRFPADQCGAAEPLSVAPVRLLPTFTYTALTGVMCMEVHAEPCMALSTAPCCNMDVAELVLDVAPDNSDCPSAIVNVTVNGAPVRGPKFRRYGVGNSRTMMVLQLREQGLQVGNADGAKVCLHFSRSDRHRGCNDPGLLVPPEVGPGTYALVSTDRRCCMVGRLGAPSQCSGASELSGLVEPSRAEAIPQGFGDKVAISRDGGVVVAQAKWREQGGSGSGSSSRVVPSSGAGGSGRKRTRLMWTAWDGRPGCRYLPPEALPPPGQLARFAVEPEFGAFIKLSSDSRTLFTGAEDFYLPLEDLSSPRLRKLPAAFLYHANDDRPRAGYSLGQVLELDAGEDLVPGAVSYARSAGFTHAKLDSVQGAMSEDGSLLLLSYKYTCTKEGPEVEAEEVEEEAKTQDGDGDDDEKPGGSKKTGGKKRGGAFGFGRRAAKQQGSSSKTKAASEGAAGRKSGSSSSSSSSKAEPAEMVLPGKVALLVRGPSGVYRHLQTLASPAERRASSTFGDVVALSGDGNWAALADDAPQGTLFIYRRASRRDRFTPYANIKDVYPAGWEAEGLALSQEGLFMALGVKLSAGRDGQRGSSMVIMYRRGPSGYSLMCSVNATADGTSLPPELDGMQMAAAGHVQRVLVSFAGQKVAHVWDFDMGAMPGAVCPDKPRHVISETTNADGNNFEAADMSRDGLLAILGMEDRNGAMVVTLPQPQP